MNTAAVEFDTSIRGEQRILAVRGELDLAVSAQFEQALRAALSATPPSGEVVVDLSGVRFFDAAALHTLLRAAREARASQVPFYFIASQAVSLVFDLLGIDVPDARSRSSRRRVLPVP